VLIDCIKHIPQLRERRNVLTFLWENIFKRGNLTCCETEGMMIQCQEATSVSKNAQNKLQTRTWTCRI